MSSASSGTSGDSWIYVMRQDEAGNYDLAWIYLDLTSPLYIYISVLRDGLRRGKWMRASDLFDDPNADLIDLRPGKTTGQQAGFSKMNTYARSLVSSLVVDMDLGGVVQVEHPGFKVKSEQPLRRMATLAFPDASTLW